MADTVEIVKDEQPVAQSKTSPVKSGGKKKFDKNSVLWCVGILVIIAVVAGALLGAINMVTYIDPTQAIKDKIASAYTVEGEVTANAGYIVNSDEVNGEVLNAFAFTADGKEMLAYYVRGKGAYSGSIDFVFYIQKDSGVVDGVTVYSSSETATIGGKVLKDANLAKLNGFELSSLTEYGSVGSSEAKNEGYYISGATMSTKGVTNALKAVAYAYNHISLE